MKIKYILTTIEVAINEEYVGRKRNVKENTIEKEIEIYDGEGLEFYEKLKDDEDIIERMEVAYELNKKEKAFKEKKWE